MAATPRAAEPPPDERKPACPSPTATTAAAAAVIAALSACSPLPDAATGHQDAHGASTAEPAGRLAAAHGLVRTGRGWSADGIQGPIPAPGSCHYRRTSDGEVLPDPRCTHGAIDTAVSQTNIGQTICRPGGYTDSVRPPLALTEALKYRMLAAYGFPASKVRDYELDHLVSESAGGSSSTLNLGPNPTTTRAATRAASTSPTTRTSSNTVLGSRVRPPGQAPACPTLHGHQLDPAGPLSPTAGHGLTTAATSAAGA